MASLRLRKRSRRPKAPGWERPLPVGRVRFDPSLRTAHEIVAAGSPPLPAAAEGHRAA